MKVTRRSEEKKMKKKEKNGGKIKAGAIVLELSRAPPTHQQAALLCERFLSFAIVGLRLLQAAGAKCVLLETPNNAGAEDLRFGKSSLPRGDLHSELGKKKDRCIVFHPGADIGGFVGSFLRLTLKSQTSREGGGRVCQWRCSLT